MGDYYSYVVVVSDYYVTIHEPYGMPNYGGGDHEMFEGGVFHVLVPEDDENGDIWSTDTHTGGGGLVRTEDGEVEIPDVELSSSYSAIEVVVMLTIMENLNAGRDPFAGLTLVTNWM